MSCFSKISATVVLDCDNLPSGGQEVNALIINRDDINYTTTTFDITNPSLMTSLELNTGSLKGYKIEGIKQTNFGDSEVVVSEEALNKFKHGFQGRIHSMTKEQRDLINEMVNSDRGFAVVIEKVWKGASSASAFVVLGWHNGLFISEGKEATNENDGVFTFKLSSRETSLEPKNPYIVMETDYATTKTAFDTGFLSGI